MAQLGFTFYPKDWWTSDSFFALNPFERYIYLELLFMMYDNGGSIKNEKIKVERRLGATIKDDVWIKITDLLIKDGDHLTSVTVNKRIKRAIASRENGKNGGAPNGNKNAKKSKEKQPKQPKKTTQNNPPSERERERERESKVNKEDLPAPEISFSEQLKANESIQEGFARHPVIPSKNEVWEYFSRNAGTRDMAKAFYDTHEATGWYYRGSPIIRFQSLAGKFIASWNQIDEKQKPKESIRHAPTLKTL